MRKPTIYEALRTKLGREPTNAELKADVQRILTEGMQEMATKGKLRHQRRRNPSARAAAHAAARKWVILADKGSKGGLYYYAGGARLGTEKREAVLFSSHAGASKALQDLKALVPRNLLKLFEWSVAALT